LRIVRLLSDQIQGKLEFFYEKGTVFRIIFPKESKS
jgi:two-component sensor histidine kinase